jgi:uncharacterized membrane protein YoaK (UPF0700 family)
MRRPQGNDNSSRELSMKPSLPTLLSLNGGYVDTAGFLALQGLFTAHVTGNFVTFGASMVFGTSGALAKLLALPVFCVVVILVRLLGDSLAKAGAPVLKILLGVKLALLITAAALAIHFGPFASGDGWQAILTGMVLVSAMAIQNAVHRVHFGTAPPTTLMTGTTTQIMIDVADMMRVTSPEARAALLARLKRMSAAVGGFGLGCAAAALFFLLAGVWCFVVPPILALFAMMIHVDDRSAENRPV